MEARPCPISEFLNGTKQMLVPLFQRSYEWSSKEWEVLWDDLLEQYERTDEEFSASHFTGAVVTAPARSVPVGVSKYLVIDGQQRLTTVTIIICAIRSLLQKDTPQYRKLTKLLINEDDEGPDYYKLLPTQPDRDAFQSLIDTKEIEASRFSHAFDYFRGKLRGADSDGNAIDLDRMAEALKSRLIVVAIHLGDSDDPYLIFESLNAKGAPLTQADLIRNYILLRLHANQQQSAYETMWLPMQKLLQDEHLTEFMRYYLMQSGEEVAKSAIYAALKKRLLKIADSAVFDELAQLRQASLVYAQIIGLLSHADPSIAKRLARLKRWEIATANPFILKMLLALDLGAYALQDVLTCLETIESFAVRRAVCGVPTNQLKRIFLSLAKDVPANGNIAEWLRATLAEGISGRRWPKDDEFQENLLRYRAYSAPVDRCKFFLETLEEQEGHKEPASYSKATIEHIMPQTLTAEWRTELGLNGAAIHERWCDLFGNLTLSAYNSELSNSPFAEKKKRFADSHFVLNEWVAQQQRWTESEMSIRTRELFEKAKKAWTRPS